MKSTDKIILGWLNGKISMSLADYQRNIRQGDVLDILDRESFSLVSDEEYKELIWKLIAENDKHIKSPHFVNHLFQVRTKALDISDEIIKKNPTLKRYISKPAVECSSLIHDLWKIFSGHHFHEIITAHWFYNEWWYKKIIKNAESIESWSDETKKEELEVFKAEVVRILLTDLCIYESMWWQWDTKSKSSYRYESPYRGIWLDEENGINIDESKKSLDMAIEMFSKFRKIIYPNVKEWILKLSTLPTTFNQIIVLYADMSDNWWKSNMTIKERWDDIVTRYSDKNGDYYDPLVVHMMKNKQFKERMFSLCRIVQDLQEKKIVVDSNFSEKEVIEYVENLNN